MGKLVKKSVFFVGFVLIKFTAQGMDLGKRMNLQEEELRKESVRSAQVALQEATDALVEYYLLRCQKAEQDFENQPKVNVSTSPILRAQKSPFSINDSEDASDSQQEYPDAGQEEREDLGKRLFSFMRKLFKR